MKTKYNNADYNEKGVTLDIGMPASGEAESITKATVSEGTIEIRDKENQKQALAGLNRDTKYSLQGTTQGNGLTGGVPPVRFSM